MLIIVATTKVKIPITLPVIESALLAQYSLS
jgi:hypothetical protein